MIDSPITEGLGPRSGPEGPGTGAAPVPGPRPPSDWDGRDSQSSGQVGARDLAAQELILAIFRLAVADFLGIPYGDNAYRPRGRVWNGHRRDALRFLTSAWAAHLADVAGFDADAVWREAQRLEARTSESASTEAAQ